MLEVKTLNRTPVPDPAKVPSQTMRQLLDMVDRRLATKEAAVSDLEIQIDTLVADIYGLSQKERRALGMEL